MSGRLAQLSSQRRTDAAVDQILSAARRLFAEHGPAGVGMAAIATEAGCSRATLYRYFDSRRALQTAFAHREALDVVGRVAERLSADGSADATEAVLLTLTEVRSRPALAAWITPESTAELLAVLRDSPLVEAVTARFASEVAPDLDVARWVLRSLVSLLAVPAEDPAEERRLVERFVAPLLAGSSVARSTG